MRCNYIQNNLHIFCDDFFSPSQLFLSLCIHFACIGMTSIHDNDQEPQFLFLFFLFERKERLPKTIWSNLKWEKDHGKVRQIKICDINDSMPCCALVNRDKKMSENFSCNQRRYDTNCMCRLLFCEINRALSHSFAHNERICSWWSSHVTLATFATSTRTFYTVIVVFTNKTRPSVTYIVCFFSRTHTYARNKSNEMHFYRKGWCVYLTYENWSTFTEWTRK